jgi:peptide/nickel transport system substrate-binding protein
MQRFLPSVPISSSPPAVVVREGVEGLIPSPLTDERFLTVSVD